MLGGGKRLRPFLLMETAALFDAARQETYQGALLAGAAPAPFGAKADILRAAARFVAERRT